MSKRPWFPFYPGDYLADTLGLTTLQHGAYLLLLMDYWAHGPLHNSSKTLCLKAGLTPQIWQRHVATAVMAFFEPGPDGLLHNKRMDHALAKALKTSESRREAVAHRADRQPTIEPTIVEAQEPKNGHPNSTIVGDLYLQNTPYARASQTPDSRIRKERKSKKAHPPTPSEGAGRSLALAGCGSGEAADFERFWKSYPRKVGKGEARRAYASALRKAEASVIQRALERQVHDQVFDVRERYQPHASTWLNGERWSDESEHPNLRLLRAVGGRVVDDDELDLGDTASAAQALLDQLKEPSQ